MSRSDVVIVSAVRSPQGRRGGVLSAMHPADLLGAVQRACVERASVDPAIVDQVVGGCVEQVGEQAANVTRMAWLDAGLPDSVAAMSVDSACGSSQQAVGMAAALVGSGAVDVAMACGLSSMSRLPIAASFDTGFDAPPTRRLQTVSMLEEFTEQTEVYGFGQFGSAERLAELYGISRVDADEFGLRSQQLAATAWDEGRFDAEVVPIMAPVRGSGMATGETHEVVRDECLRETSRKALAELKPVARENGIHTAGTSSQIADGAAAILIMSEHRATSLGCTPLARIVDHCHVGVDPLLMLTGPLDATQRMLDRTGHHIEDFEVLEVNEAFAAVPLMWLRHFDVDEDRLNPNGGAISLGHPVGATGTRLIVTAVHELIRTDGTLGLTTMCAGGGLGTATVIERP